MSLSSETRKFRALALVRGNKATTSTKVADVMGATFKGINDTHEGFRNDTSARKIRGQHAIVYLCDSKGNEEYIEELLHNINTNPTKVAKFDKLRKSIKHGDLLEDVALSGESTSGIYFFDRRLKDIQVVRPGKYGLEYAIPEHFELFKPHHQHGKDKIQFLNPYYWDFTKMRRNNYVTIDNHIDIDDYIDSDKIAGYIVHIPSNIIRKYGSIISVTDVPTNQRPRDWVREANSAGKVDSFKIVYMGLTYLVQMGIDPINLQHLVPQSGLVELDENNEIVVFGTYTPFVPASTSTSTGGGKTSRKKTSYKKK
jgi:hypothetical protein